MLKVFKNISSLRLIYTIFLILIFLFPVFTPTPKEGPTPPPNSNLQKALSLKKTLTNKISSNQISHFTNPQILSAIQKSRESISLDPLIVNSKICKPAESLFNTSVENNQLTLKDLELFCPQCSQKAYITTQGNYNVKNQPAWMDTEDIKALTQDDFTHACIYSQNEYVLVLLGTIITNPPTETPASKEINILNFTREQLWQALVDYRHAHTKSDLQQSDNLCAYASKRVAEHIEMYANKPKADYLNQDKYPLDAHAGFSRDGQSGYLFEATGFNMVAENLAYWPTAQAANQVIEWGWDTSTEGHKEAQLSEEYSHACIMGSDGFFVAIFAKN